MRAEFSKRTRRDAFARAQGNCECCSMRIKAAAVQYDHRIPCALGGDNSLDNCQVLCIPCHKDKTGKSDMRNIAKAVRISDREMGIRKPSKIRSAGFRKAPPQRSASRPLERT